MVETLRKAIEWRRQLDARRAASQGAIARREAVTCARGTQIMMLLRLGPGIRERILVLPPTAEYPAMLDMSYDP
jgi:hypothetical protein